MNIDYSADWDKSVELCDMLYNGGVTCYVVGYDDTVIADTVYMYIHEQDGLVWYEANIYTMNKPLIQHVDYIKFVGEKEVVFDVVSEPGSVAVHGTDFTVDYSLLTETYKYE